MSIIDIIIVVCCMIGASISAYLYGFKAGITMGSKALLEVLHVEGVIEFVKDEVFAGWKQWDKKIPEKNDLLKRFFVEELEKSNPRAQEIGRTIIVTKFFKKLIGEPKANADIHIQE